MIDPAPRPRPPRRIVLVAGPSGSGKGMMARRSGLPLVALDDFYRDEDDPGLPRRFGIVDWDDPASWNEGEALAALTALAHDGAADLPEYSIPRSRRTGSTRLALGEERLIVAEGIFAARLLPPLAALGLLADALVLDRPTPLVFGLRLARDLRDSRKPPLTLLRRGWGLAGDQAGDIAAWTAAGMRPVGLHEGVRALRSLADLAEAEQHHAAAGGAETVLRIAAVCFLREGPSGPELLSVRKRGTGSYMQVGGKLEPGEDAAEAAVREVLEELDVALDPEDLELLGRFDEVAANEPGTRVEASVFLAPPDVLPRDVAVQAELEDLFWCPLDADAAGRRLAPLMTRHILPHLRSLLSEPSA
ncbi:NUDIX domain-containing protein [Brachybacterium hainanense]|uniref:NUDIX domain-containing protein n=1 Tax=Brachybacterium hainanense TaxID=1541174 RepID=A0ABV6RE74_9MICO